MANKGLLYSLGEEGDTLNGKNADFEIDSRPQRSCFLSPFLCGTTDPKLIAYVHLGIMGGVSLLLLIIFTIMAIVYKDILFYVGLIGAFVALIPLPFIAFATLGLVKRRANTSIPLIVFLCFVGVSFTGLFAFLMVISFGADTNAHAAIVFGYALSIGYLSHIIRVLLRVRLDTLEDRLRPSQLR